MAANHFLSVLPDAPVLRRLRLSGPCAASAKFQPIAPGGREALDWLWSVVRLQGLHHQFGLSGPEIAARQQLFGERLRISHGGDGGGWCRIDVLPAGEAA